MKTIFIFFYCFCFLSFFIFSDARGKEQNDPLILEGHSGIINTLSFTPDGRLLTSGSNDNTIKIWDPKTGRELASLISLYNNEWVVVTPEGFFDGSPGGMSLIRWKIDDKFYFLEQFFNEFYHPGLLADIYRELKPIPEILKERKDPRAYLNIVNKDRRLPEVFIKCPEKSSERIITLNIHMEEAPPDKDHSYPSGIKDLRLFRNGTLVKLWSGELKIGNITCKVPIVAGDNFFTAYAFNKDNIKSRDANIMVTGDQKLKREPRAYVLSIGINKYSISSFNLNYSVKDAEDIADELKKNLPISDPDKNIHVIKLLDSNATRKGIIKALNDISKKAQPEDIVVVTYAGHGINYENSFFIIPYDLGKEDNLTEKMLARKGISDKDLYNIFVGDDKNPGFQAQCITLILDACFSGQALESDEWRVGPMNSRGLAQLAWEKGMEILTASQSNQVANELKRLNHGILTSCLLEGFSKASRKNNKLHVRNWLDYAVQEVPKIIESDACRSIILSYKGKNMITVQTPRVFYRRGEECDWIVSEKPVP